MPSRSLPAYWPLARSGHITSGFGERIDPIFHRKVEQHLGIDIGAPIGTPVLAAGDGTVEISGYSRSAGFRVEIDHKYGYRSVYYHLLKVTAHRGDHVHQGEIIGHVGNTGHSTGSHLHFGISYKNQFIDPLGILKAKG